MSPFPSDAIKGLIDLVSSGQVLSNLRQVGVYLCAILSYFLGATVATACGRRPVLHDDCESDLSEKLLLDLSHALHTMRDHVERHFRYCGGYVRAGEADTVGIDPATIAVIVSLIQMLGPMIMNTLKWIHDRRHPAPAPTA
jgi:hypothetical protein